MEANIGEENPAVLLVPAGSSAWGLQTPFYCRLDIEEHIFNAVFNLRSQNRIFFKTLSNVLENISCRPLVLICALFFKFPFFAQLALPALLWNIHWLIIWYLIICKFILSFSRTLCLWRRTSELWNNIIMILFLTWWYSDWKWITVLSNEDFQLI